MIFTEWIISLRIANSKSCENRGQVKFDLPTVSQFVDFFYY